ADLGLEHVRDASRAVLREDDPLADLEESQGRVQADEAHAADDQDHEAPPRRMMRALSHFGEDVMRDGIYIVDGDGHVMDFPHRGYRKSLPEQSRRRIAFFPGAQWARRQAPNGDMGRDPDTPQEMLADLGQEGIDLAFLYPTSALRIGEIREADY